MLRFVLKRLGISVLVVFLISTITFSLVRFLPGDPAVLAVGTEASVEDIERVRAEYNLDKPYIEQYRLWITGVLQGDLGESITFHRGVDTILQERLPVTVSIGVPALLLSAILGILLGIVSATHRGRTADKVVTLVSTIGVGTPVFWIGILCIYLFAMTLHLLPIQGYTAPTEDFGQYIYRAILPVFCLSLSMTASVARQTRSNMLEVINQDYIRTSRANGLGERRVIFLYALKNTLIPVLTIIAMQIRTVVGGSVLVEQLFNIPGIGTLLITAINGRDYAVIQACVFMISMVTVSFNLIVDLLYGVVDPKIRKSRG